MILLSWHTFHVIDGAGKTIDDKSGIEEFIIPVTLPQAADAIMKADKVINL